MNAPLTSPPPVGPAARTQRGSPLLRLHLIGLMQAHTSGGENVLPIGRKTRAVLAVTALSAPRPALRTRLAELLWSRRPEEQARASLRQEIHRLHESLLPAGEETLVVTRDHVSLYPGRVWVDAAEVMSASRQNPAPLALLDGELLEDLHGLDSAFDAWLSTERERLRDRSRALAELILHDQSDPASAIPAAQRLLQIDRAHEGAWRALMRAHAARGERGMAIQAYDRCRTALADLLDAAPSAETQKVLSEIRGPPGARLKLRPLPLAGLAEPVDPAPEPEPHAPGPARGGAHLGVMPLVAVGTGEQEDALAIGLAEEIGAALSRIRWLFVVSAPSLARFADSGRDDTAIRRTFGLDLLLDGTIQRVDTKLRIALRLLDLRHGGKVAWAGRFDRADGDLLALQDEIAGLAAAQIEPQVMMQEADRAAAQPAESATAYELMLRSLPAMHRMELASFMAAQTDLRQAIEREPDFAAAHAWLGAWHVLLASQGWADPAEVAEEAAQLTDRAIRLDPFDARVMVLAAHVRAVLQRELASAAVLHERALSLNPNQAMAWALSAATQAWLGETAEATRQLERYKALTPLHPHAFVFDGTFATVRLLERDFEGAVVAGRQATQMNPAWCASHKPYLAALGHLGLEQEAATVRRRLLALEPGFGVRRFLRTEPFARAQDRELFAQGLRRAGVPEN